MNINDYFSLPETLEAPELRLHFVELLASPISSLGDAILVVRALRELSDRQWHNYERVSVEIASAVTNWIEINWAPRCVEFISAACAVAAMLGLPRIVELAEATLKREPEARVRQYLFDFVMSERRTGGDPYAGMPRS